MIPPHSPFLIRKASIRARATTNPPLLRARSHRRPNLRDQQYIYLTQMGKSTNNTFSSSSSSSSIVDDSSVRGLCGSGGVTIKFLCSYGGKILPRYPDGKLRYFGGETRVLAVDRYLSFSELLAKMGELCGRGSQVSLRCQLPTEDLDALISITSDEDLANLTEEYDLANRDRSVSPLKIRAFLHFPSTTSPPISVSSVKGKAPFLTQSSSSSTSHRRISPPSSARLPCHNQHRHHQYKHQYRQHCTACGGHGGSNNLMASLSSSERYQRHAHLVHNGNHWQ